MNPQATAGRIVHYTDAAGESVAAIVNRETGPDGLAQLTTFFQNGPMPMKEVPYSEEPAAGCWSWMPYQKTKAREPDGNQSESAELRPEGDRFAQLMVGINERFNSLEKGFSYLMDQAEPDPPADVLEDAQTEPPNVKPGRPPVDDAPEVPGPAPVAQGDGDDGGGPEEGGEPPAAGADPI